MDHREHPCYPDYIKCDFARMTMRMENDEGEEVDYKAAFTVCPDCDGKGSYVNPSIDSHGLSGEDFDEDPDFRESYMRGDYDISCRSCGGERVILEPATEEGRRVLSDILRCESDSRACYEAERRMGA